MPGFPNPIVVVSRCLTFEACRYDGTMKGSEVVERMKSFVEFVPMCPEVGIGLGVPCATIEVVKREDGIRLVQPSTGRDLSEEMDSWARGFLDSVRRVDGFILKARSPSCGLGDVPLLVPEGGRLDTTDGFFARAAITRYPDLPMTSEQDLEDDALRARFLESVFERAGAHVPAELQP